MQLKAQESQPFDPFQILGLETTATDGDIDQEGIQEIVGHVSS